MCLIGLKSTVKITKIDFIYLVQGEARKVKLLFHLKERKRAEALFLTYDEKISSAYYLPNSTWSEGRNYLLQKALSKYKDYKYIIFVDDDTEFYYGNWELFEQNLMEYNPLIGVPVFDKNSTVSLPCNNFIIQSFEFNDEQLIAFHKKTIKKGILLPYDSKLDEVSWWATCRKQQILIQNKYKWNSIQFNNIRVINNDKGRYSSKSKNWKKYEDYVKISIDSASNTISKKCRDIEKNSSITKSVVNTLILCIRNSYYCTLTKCVQSIFIKNKPQKINKNNLSKYLKFEENITLHGMSQRYLPNIVRSLLKFNENLNLRFVDMHGKAITVGSLSYESEQIKSAYIDPYGIIIITNKIYQNENFYYLKTVKNINKNKIFVWDE